MAKSQDTDNADKNMQNDGRSPKATVVTASKPKKTSSKKGGEMIKPPLFKTVGGKIGLAFATVSCYLFLSVFLSRYWSAGWDPLVAPGRYLSSAFSWAAFYLPIWCLLAGILAISPKFYPRLTYLLASSALPFLVAAGFARISTEPGAFFENHPIFAAVGLSSLYAGLGFLFAASFGIVIFGFAKMTAWMKATGKPPRRQGRARRIQSGGETPDPLLFGQPDTAMDRRQESAAIPG